LSSADSKPTFTPRTIAWLAVKLAVFAVVLVFVVLALVDRCRAVDWRNLHPDVACLAGAVALLAVSGVVSGTGYRMLLTAFGYPIRWTMMLGVVWVSQLGKYVPGKLLSVAGGMYLLKKQNVPMPVGMAINVMLMGLYVVVGLMVAAPLVVFERITLLGPLTWLWSLLVLAGGVVMLHPRVFVGAINFGLRRLGREPLANRLRLRDYGGPLAMVCIQWLLIGMAFWLTARSVGDVPLARAPFVISASALAVTIGFVAVFAPAGLGVREGLLLLLFAPVLGDATTALVIVSMRFFQVVVEVSLAGVGMIILRLTPAPSAAPTPE
jgi:uncharacterized membrane protein YbhN (UPF0104 family)